jgi:tRNA(Ile)-lysidine synthase
MGWRAGLVSVDHGLQAGSDKRAVGVAEWGLANGLAPSEHVSVVVEGVGGPEAAAREARYRALARLARTLGATCVLLGHTEDDQAETVLLALARGSGARGLAAMPVEREIEGERFVRPLLGVSRKTCREACAALGLSPWDDPHNVDPAYARARVRKDVMPVLVEALGTDVVPNLARTAAQLGADATYLDAIAQRALAECRDVDGLSVAALQTLPDPLRTRVLHAWAIDVGVPRAALSHRHVAALDALITDWHGQGATQLPGQVSVRRAAGALVSDNRS